MRLLHLTPVQLPPGEYKYKVVISTGPVLVQTRADNADSFATETDGSLSASGNGTFKIGKGELLQVSLQSGDAFYINETGIE